MLRQEKYPVKIACIQYKNSLIIVIRNLKEINSKNYCYTNMMTTFWSNK